MPNPRASQLISQAERVAGLGDYFAAEDLCQQVLKRNPREAEALALMGQIAYNKGLADDAEQWLDKALRIKPRMIKALLYHGLVKARQGRYADAVTSYEKILRRHPGHAYAVSGLAHALMLQGEKDRARELLQPFVDEGREDAGMAYIFATLEINAGRPERALEITARNLGRTGLAPDARRKLHIATGKAHEKTGAYDEAFEAYTSGWKVYDIHFDARDHVARVDQTIELFTPERLARLPRAGERSDLPIFVVGMPRSGSTLVETIIDAHPRATGAGELNMVYELADKLNLRINSSLPYPACILDMVQADADELSRDLLGQLRLLAGDADRVVDKFLANYMHLGLLSLIHPGARVIDCRRDPLDGCMSCYAEALSPASHQYAADLESLGLVYRQYERLMRHWNEVLDIPILTVRYEQLVADQEPQTRAIIEFCGLAWDDACLRFHESGRQAGTLSFDQVRRPMYRSAMGRAEKFERHLGPLRESLDRHGPGGEGTA